MDEVLQIQNLIYEIRGYKVMLDSDLAALYEVETRVLNQAVKRNILRFPKDFMFQLTKAEFENLISQNVSSSWGGVRKLPYVFTEQGVSMLSGILKSRRAIEINIQIMRTFVRMRQWALENNEMANRLMELEHYFIEHTKENKEDMCKIYDAINLLMDRTKPQKIGFTVDNN